MQMMVEKKVQPTAAAWAALRDYELIAQKEKPTVQKKVGAMVELKEHLRDEM